MKTEIVYFQPLNQDVVTKSGFRYLDTSSKEFSRETIEAETEIGIFEQFYKKNNRLRYCNGSYFLFADPLVNTRYSQWLKSDDYQKKSHKLYYGNGIVD